MCSRPVDKKKNNTFLYRAISILFLVISIICIVSLIMTLLIFIGDVNITNQYFRDLYDTIINLDHCLDSERLEQIKTIENVYKNARTFDVMSFFYMFISTILISLVVYYYNRMNKIIRDNKNIREKLTKEFQKRVNDFEGRIMKINNTALEVSSLLNNIESMCLQDSKNARMRINDYMPRLRHNLYKFVRLLEDEMSLSNKKITLPYSQIHFISELFYGFTEKINKIAEIRNDIIKQDTIDEFLNYVDNCKDYLGKLQKMAKSD